MRVEILCDSNKNEMVSLQVFIRHTSAMWHLLEIHTGTAVFVYARGPFPVPTLCMAGLRKQNHWWQV